MSCLDNLANITYPIELVYNLTKLYTFRGKDFYYENVFKQYMDATIKRTIEEDTFYASKILKLNVTDARLKLLIVKDSNPKNHEEAIVKNIKNVLTIIQEKGTELTIDDNEFLQLAIKLFQNAKKISYDSTIVETKYNLITERKKQSRRDQMKLYLEKYKTCIQKSLIEPTQAITCLYIDLINTPMFTEENDFIYLIMLYSLLFSHRFNAFKFISFFKKYYGLKNEFESAVITSSRNWEYGTAKTEIFNTLLVETLIKCYEEVDNNVKNYYFDKSLKKQDNVEAIIIKMPKTFTKQDVKDKCPNLSDSTIRRALENLQEQGKIQSTGTGRSAKWIKIQEDEFFTPKTLQTNIFDLIGNDTDF